VVVLSPFAPAPATADRQTAPTSLTPAPKVNSSHLRNSRKKLHNTVTCVSSISGSSSSSTSSSSKNDTINHVPVDSFSDSNNPLLSHSSSPNYPNKSNYPCQPSSHPHLQITTSPFSITTDTRAEVKVGSGASGGGTRGLEKVFAREEQTNNSIDPSPYGHRLLCGDWLLRVVSASSRACVSPAINFIGTSSSGVRFGTAAVSLLLSWRLREGRRVAQRGDATCKHTPANSLRIYSCLHRYIHR
jgi:hypothetical protein